MKVLVVGSGGREHALCWKIRRSPRVARLWCAPGNAGIAGIADCVPIAAADVGALRDFARREGIDLTVVGPELPLTMGIVDDFEREGLRVFGPDRAAARLEASKAFAKEVLEECRVPTASFGVFDDAERARAYVAEREAPIVVKADGLAAGKGVFVCATKAEALAAVDECLRGRLFGAAGERVVIEEFLCGEEASFLVITDGQTAVPLASSQDHKRVFDGDRGPNTGGMGAYSPAPVVTPAVAERVMREVIHPVLGGLRRRGIRYRGVLYAGLMIEGETPRVLEFNVRFGDPECQALLVRLRSDLVEVMEKTIDGRLAGTTLDWDPRPSVCIVLAAAGYPATVRKGDAIAGLDAAARTEDAILFHAGTAAQDGRIVTTGGRVLGVTALGDTLDGALATAYGTAAAIRWEGMHYRKDIGARADEGRRARSELAARDRKRRLP